MSKWYVSQTSVALVEGKPVATETPLTRPDTERATREMHRRMKAIGVPDIHVCRPNSKRYNRLMREQNRKTKPVTIADVAEAMREFEGEAKDQG